MNIPRAIWGLIGVAVCVLLAIGWLAYHDRRVRETAELSTVIAAKSDTIAMLNRDIAALGKAIKAADDAYATAKGTVTRVLYVPPALRDSLFALNRQLDSLTARGDTAVPIGVAQELRQQLNACTAKRDTAADSLAKIVSSCDAARALRDSTIASQREIVRQMTDQLAATQKLAGLSQPRFSPFVGAQWSFVHRQPDIEAGAALRLFSTLHLTAAVRLRDSLDILAGLRYEFK